jgi:membrane fusion protein (multidrug efflux system)
LLAAGYLLHDVFLYEDTDDAQVEGHIMPLSARVSGQVLEVRVVQGQLVHSGDVLVAIDPKDYRIAVEQAQAMLADAKASASMAHPDYFRDRPKQSRFRHDRGGQR